MAGKRVHERHDCELDVSILHEQSEISAKTVNLSLGGTFVRADRVLPFGTTVRLRIPLPALKEPCEVDATVRWHRDEGMGLQFGSLRAIEVWGLNQLFRGL